MQKSLLNAHIHLTEGNLKLAGNESEVGFLIWNIPAVVTCSDATEICKNICYARNDEIRFPKTVLPSRQENYAESLKDTFEQDMINHIQYHLDRKKYKDKTIYFRIHSSGDFYSTQYFKKWVNITNHFKGQNIVFEAYTKAIGSLMYFKDELDQINITLCYSIMPDTNPVLIALAKTLNVKRFHAVPIGALPNEGFHCPGQCGPCGICYHKDNGVNDIYIEFHGTRARLKLPVIQAE